jgi:transposase
VAVVGRFGAHHAILIAEHLGHLDEQDEGMERVNAEIAQRLRKEEAVIALPDTAPGIGRRAAEIILADIGGDVSRFPSAKHLARWAAICPGNAQSGGKRLSGRTRTGNRWLRQAPIETAHVASKTMGAYLTAQCHRPAARRGKKRALVALGHTILVIAHHSLSKRESYRDLGPACFDALERARVERRLVGRLERLGYTVSLQPPAPASTAAD